VSLVFSIVNFFCMALLYGRAGRSTAQNGDFRPRWAGEKCEKLLQASLGLIEADVRSFDMCAVSMAGDCHGR
jgi:hypothetical protein